MLVGAENGNVKTASPASLKIMVSGFLSFQESLPVFIRLLSLNQVL